MNLIEKLNAIQRELAVPKAKKNDFGGFNYRSCEDILKALSPLMTQHRTVINLSEELVEVCGSPYIKATAKLMDCESMETVSSTSFAKEPESKKGMDAAQVTGSTTSYARKYALAALFAIDNEKDADAIEGNATEAPESAQKTSSEPVGKNGKTMLAMSSEIEERRPGYLAKLCAKKGVNDISGLTIEYMESAWNFVMGGAK